MQLRHRVALDGVELDSLDNRILVLGVSEAAAKMQSNAVSLFGGSGQRLTVEHRDYLDITVRFGLKIRRSADELIERSELFERVVGWAVSGGWLTVNYKPDRRVYVHCAQLPTPGDQYAWTSEYTITFRAYGVPYWQRVTPTSITFNSTQSASRALEISGNTKSVLEMTFVNRSGYAISTAKLTAGSRYIELSGLGLANGETLELDHDEEGLLRIRIRNTGGVYRSVMNCRTEGSADELWASPGSIGVTFTAQRPGQLTVRCYGRYA